MTLLLPPEPDTGEALLNHADVFITPCLGFHYFWHQRHDQARTAQGYVACRHCKPPKRAGGLEVDTYVRKQSWLAAAALHVAGGQGQHFTVQAATTSSGPSGLVLRELDALGPTQWAVLPSIAFPRSPLEQHLPGSSLAGQPDAG